MTKKSQVENLEDLAVKVEDSTIVSAEPTEAELESLEPTLEPIADAESEPTSEPTPSLNETLATLRKNLKAITDKVSPTNFQESMAKAQILQGEIDQLEKVALTETLKGDIVVAVDKIVGEAKPICRPASYILVKFEVITGDGAPMKVVSTYFDGEVYEAIKGARKATTGAISTGTGKGKAMWVNTKDKSTHEAKGIYEANFKGECDGTADVGAWGRVLESLHKKGKALDYETA